MNGAQEWRVHASVMRFYTGQPTNMHPESTSTAASSEKGLMFEQIWERQDRYFDSEAPIARSCMSRSRDHVRVI